MNIISSILGDQLA